MTTVRNFLFLFLFASCDNKIRKNIKPIISTTDTIKNEIFTGDNKDSLYKIGSFIFNGDKDLIFDIIDNHNPPQKIKSKGDTLFTDNDTTILGDFKKTDISVFKKYNLKYNFDDFKVDKIYKGIFAKPKLVTDPSSYYFKTRIRDGCAQDSINFAGHYTIAEWGCGTECGMMAVIDRITGRVYYSSKYLPFDTADGHWGISYRKESRMIIVNSYLLDDYQGYSMVQWRKVGVYEWTGNGFNKLK